MDTKRIHEDITQLLYKIEEQYGRIIHFKDSIPMLEIDLALKDVRDLYECLLDLRTATELKRRQQAFNKDNSDSMVAKPAIAPIPVAEVKPAPVPAETAKPVEVPVEEPKAEVRAEVLPEPETKVAEKPVTEISSPLVETPAINQEEAPKVVAEKEAAAAEILSEKVAEVVNQLDSKPEQSKEDKADVKPPVSAVPAKEVPPVAPKKDLLQERQKDFVPTVRKIEFKPDNQSSEPARKESLFDKAASLYDKIAKPTDKTVATQASRQPISNIKSSIGINEKFIYLKDLFKNNINDYNEALEKLNNFDSYEEAEDFFQDLKQKYGWDPDSKSFQGLADLLSRRYLHNASS